MIEKGDIMGLDMYLYTNSRKLAMEVHKDEPYGDYITKYYRRSGVAIYWRKANAIHQWFVDNVQGGNDDCEIHEVFWEQLMELRDLCKRVIDGCPLVDGTVNNGMRYTENGMEPITEDGMVLSNRQLAEQLLPTQSGFFFGSTDYDQWYYQDVEWTLDELNRIESIVTVCKDKFGGYSVGMKGEPDWEVRFYYRSSW